MRIILSLFFCLPILIAKAQQSKETNYTAAYKIIDSLILKERLTKTAIDKVDQLYKKAVVEKQEAEQIKALVYKADLENELTEEGFNNTLSIFKGALKKANSPIMQAVLHIIIAKKYNDYYTKQKWTLLSRRNWNSNAFKDSIEMHFKAANQSNKELQAIYIDTYSAIVLGGSEPLKNYSLYHLLIAEQIQYYSNDLGNDGSKENKEKITGLYDAIFQLHQHEQRNNIVARFKLDLLTWKKENQLIKEEELLTELKNYTYSEYASSIKASAWFLIANTIAEKGKQYHALNNTINQFELVKAISIIDQAAKEVDSTHYKTSGLSDLFNEIKSKQIWMEIEQINETQKPFRAYLSYKNTDTLFLKVLKVNTNFTLKTNSSDNQIKELLKQELVQEQTIPLLQANDYQTHYTEIKIDPLPQGNYIVLTSTGKDFSLAVNKIGYMHFAVADWVYFKDNNHYFIRAYSTGKPVEQAQVKIYETKYDYKSVTTNTVLIHQTETNKNGQFSIPQKLNGNTQIEVNKKKSQLIFSEYEYRYQEFSNQPNERITYEQNNRRIYFFTDRSIYRPGQAVQFKGIALTKDYDTKFSKIVEEKNPVKIYLTNANRQRIDSLLLPINHYGSIVGSFVLPINGLTGNFGIEAQLFNYSSKNIKVEEYKRPSIKLIFDQPKIGYRLNDSIHYTIKAQAYAGNIVNGAKVKFTVKQYGRYPYPIARNMDPIYQSGAVIASGIGITNEKGAYTLSFKAIYDSTKELSSDFSVNYIIQADITDLNGETQSGNINLTATKTAWQLVINHPIAVNKERFKTINATAIDQLGNEKNTPIQTALYKVIEPNRLVRKKYWGKSDLHLFDENTYKKYFPTDEYQTETNPDTWATEETPTPMNQLETGMYKIKATAIDSFGLPIAAEKIITIYDVNEGTKSKHAFNYYSNNYNIPGDSILAVTNYPIENTYVTKKIKKSERKEEYQFVQSNKLTQQQIIVTAEDRGGMVITEAYILMGRLFTHQQAIAVPFNNKELKIRTGSFRNINEPGAKETWTIEIEGLNGKEKAAELLTAMYDASLDALYPNKWDPLNLWNTNNSSTNFSSSIFRTETIRQFDNNECFCEAKPYERPSLLSSINLAWRIREQRLYETTAAESKKAMTASPPPGNKQAQDLVQVRTNFNETAFFFPQLYADSSGKYQFSFQFPDAVNQWKWMSFAHTKDLATGYAEQKLQTQKSLMVQPNIPRFLREGDQMELSVKIANLTNKELTGTIALELIDATTQTSVDGWFQNVFPQQYFTVEAGQSSIAQFPIQVPFSYNKPLRYRIIARTNELSDGEENTVAVLSNRQLVTETLPIYLQKDTTQQFRFEKLLNNQSEGISTQGLTVEYTTQPIWNAIQALGYLKTDPERSAIHQINRIYANCMALHVLNKYPMIATVLEQWKKDSTALNNPLENNAELKQILLQETPWVMDAKTGSILLRELANLMDIQTITKENEAWLVQLAKLQLPDGSFSWFEGGRSDEYITRYILTGIGKLKRIGAITPSISAQLRPLLMKALAFTDEAIRHEYKKSKPVQIESSQLDYLYMRSFYKENIIQNDTAYKAYWQIARNSWNKQNQYAQAMIALIAKRNNEIDFANKILKALLENTVTNQQQGMYWKNRLTLRWYAMPIVHQTMMIDCFSEINNETTTKPYQKQINAMLTWLILNKETNHWGTGIATADAVYSLVANGQQWMSNKRAVRIELGKTTIGTATEKTMEGSGYFKKRIEGDKVKAEMGNITVTTATQNMVSDQPSYGSIYWQYLANMDEITASTGPMLINKKLLVERNKAWIELNENEPVKVGELITVSLSMKIDRDMDYVHLKDLRPAATEPTTQLSGYRFQENLFYYQSTKDVSNNYYFSYLPKGNYQFTYTIRATHKGLYTAGFASIQSMYAPAFNAHSNAIKLRIEQ
ncbi:MAG: hypothetical protein B7Y37_09090 [Sphingobacteriia bacterium 28-36-52]|nr:MAG: hypothetical protein B7Y37_09090 [Sphingobacteriia bacterium 28-36-52]